VDDCPPGRPEISTSTLFTAISNPGKPVEDFNLADTTRPARWLLGRVGSIDG